MGSVNLIATEYWPHVEIRQGLAASPDQMTDVMHNGPVNAGQNFPAAEGNRQCYRRSSNPGIPNSPLNQWYCNSNDIDGVENWDIE
jgi:hypothetical protein